MINIPAPVNKIINKLKSVDLNKLDKKQLIMIGVIVLLVFGLDIGVFLNAQLKSLKNVNLKLSQARKEMVELNKGLEAMKKIQSGRPGAADTLTKAKNVLAQGQVPSFLEAISTLANDNSIRIARIKSSKDEEVVATKAKKGQKPAAADSKLPGSGKAGPIKITLEVSGGYHDFGKFLNELENGREFVSLQEMKIVGSPEDQVNQVVMMELRTYAK
jgi:Tfp pilus assembly protein PilO